jgi:undecaprenyl-diphosphatase
LNTIIIFAAQYLLFIIILIAVVFWATLPKAQKVSFIVYGTLATIITYLLSRLASMVFYNPRPFVISKAVPLIQHAADNGFPSDHTLLSALVAFVVFRYSKLWGSILLVLTLLVGGSRIVAKVHSPLDVIGAIAIAGVGCLLSMPLEKWIGSKVSWLNIVKSPYNTKGVEDSRTS